MSAPPQRPLARLAGKIAMVTGAASGIGRASALALAREGAQVIATDIDGESGRETCAAIFAAGGRASFFIHDVADEDSWNRLMDNIGGVLHVLVNNAGICIASPVLEMSTASWRRQLGVNLDGVFFGTRLAVPLIAQSGGGSIVNVSSVAGLKGVAGLSGYCASKGAVRMFTKAVALECAAARNRVRVNAVHPGAIETPIWVKMAHDGEMPPPDAARHGNAMQAARDASNAATPLGHAGTPEDIAAGIVYLASDDARFVTGTELVIDGGVMAG